MARAAVATHVVDTSAHARSGKPSIDAKVKPLLGAGLLATCAVLDLEILSSARNRRHFDEVRAERELLYEQLPLEQPVFAHALAVQQRLAEAGEHRTVPLADLIIAAVAERHELIVLHYDADYDRIAKVTGQQVAWIVPRGSAD